MLENNMNYKHPSHKILKVDTSVYAGEPWKIVDMRTSALHKAHASMFACYVTGNCFNG